MRSWESKKKDILDKLKIVTEEIKMQNEVMVAALSRGGRINDTRVKDSCFKTIENCQKILKEKMEEQLKLQMKLAHINEKKPKKQN